MYGRTERWKLTQLLQSAHGISFLEPAEGGCDTAPSMEKIRPPSGAVQRVALSASECGRFPSWRRALLSGIVTASLLLTACKAADPGGGEGVAGGSDVAPDEVLTDDGTLVDCTALERPPTPLRRLTRFEYDNTVRDLLGTTLTPSTNFPPDEVAEGFSNNALVLTVSSLHAEKYTFAAEALAEEVVSKLDTLVQCDPAALDEEACARQFAETFGRRAYRRALEPEDVAALMEAYALGDSFEKGIEIMVRAALQSPHFLFRVEFSGAQTPGTGMVRLNGYETATRLSYLIWSSTPDQALLDAAEAGELETPEQVANQARRMLQDPKARRAVTEFYRQWLELTRLEVITKDVDAFPLWSEAMRGAMQAESQAVVEQVLFEEDASLERLLTAPLGLPSGPLAELYGVPESSSVAMLPAAERAGVLTLPGFLAVQAHPDQTAPVLRGKFVRTKLLCGEVQPPPDNVDISAPNPAEGGTARERFSAHAESGCTSCHQLMDPIGYPFESYDSMGQFRTTDAGQEMDLSGEFVATKAIDGPFVGVHEMLSILAGSQEVSDCVAKQPTPSSWRAWSGRARCVPESRAARPSAGTARTSRPRLKNLPVRRGGGTRRRGSDGLVECVADRRRRALG